MKGENPAMVGLRSFSDKEMNNVMYDNHVGCSGVMSTWWAFLVLNRNIH